jgi:hypothetical protein
MLQLNFCKVIQHTEITPPPTPPTRGGEQRFQTPLPLWEGLGEG